MNASMISLPLGVLEERHHRRGRRPRVGVVQADALGDRRGAAPGDPGVDRLLREAVPVAGERVGVGLAPRRGGREALGGHQRHQRLEVLLPAEPRVRRDVRDGSTRRHVRDQLLDEVAAADEVDQHHVEVAERRTGQPGAVEHGPGPRPRLRRSRRSRPGPSDRPRRWSRPSRPVALMSRAVTSAPTSTRILVVASPIPDAAPVTITRRPSYPNTSSIVVPFVCARLRDHTSATVASGSRNGQRGGGRCRLQGGSREGSTALSMPRWCSDSPRVGFGLRRRLFGWRSLDSFDASDRTVVVTGPTSGIGRAAALRLARGWGDRRARRTRSGQDQRRPRRDRRRDGQHRAGGRGGRPGRSGVGAPGGRADRGSAPLRRRGRPQRRSAVGGALRDRRYRDDGRRAARRPAPVDQPSRRLAGRQPRRGGSSPCRRVGCTPRSSPSTRSRWVPGEYKGADQYARVKRAPGGAHRGVGSPGERGRLPRHAPRLGRHARRRRRPAAGSGG